MYQLGFNLADSVGFRSGAGGRGAVLTRVLGPRPALPAGRRQDMTPDQKIIRAKVGLPEVAKPLGNCLPRRRPGSAKPAR